MSKGYFTVAALTAFVMTIVVATTAAQEDGDGLRTWTSAAGVSLKAEFVSYEDGIVSVKTEDGKLMKIRVTELSKEDQEYVKKTVGAEAAPATPPKPGPKVLPLLEGETWSEVLRHGRAQQKPRTRWMHASVSKTDYEAWVAEDGSLYIQPRINPVEGQYQRPLRARVGTYFHPNKQGGYEWRKFVRFIDPPQPVRNPREVTLTMEFETNVIVKVTYTFQSNRVEVAGELSEPDDIEYPTIGRISIGIPPSHIFSDQITVEEGTKQTAHCKLEVERLNGDDQTYDYYESTNLRGSIKAVEIEGHWRGRKIVIEPADRDGRPWIHNYAGKPPFAGYGVYSQCHASEDSPKEIPGLEITVR